MTMNHRSVLGTLILWLFIGGAACDDRGSGETQGQMTYVRDATGSMADGGPRDMLAVRNLDQAVSDVEAIYRAARLRVSQQSGHLDRLL